MRRALFSSEAGLGTAPIAHSAVRTPEPVTEGVVAGLEPFIDTIVVCTITALVVLVSGVWNRAPLATWGAPPTIVSVGTNQWKPSSAELPSQDAKKLFRPGQTVFAVVEIDGARHRLEGVVKVSDPATGGEGIGLDWKVLDSVSTPVLAENGVFADFRGSTMAALAFDSARPGLGKWMVTLAVWLFAFATIIAYGYYGEQAVTYFGGGARSVFVYRIAWCAVVAVTCLGYIRTSVELDTLSTVAMGFMYAVNLPLLLLLGPRVMRTWHDYFRRYGAGQIR
jgi:AGCS family alanine or glycine:cation symporter